MEIPLLLLLVILAMVVMGEARARRPAVALEIAEVPLELPMVPDDGLVALPSAVRPYSEKASRAEMNFAGLYLNFIGIALLTVGALSYLRVSGLTSSGWLQCCLGSALGVFLSWAGDRCHRQGLRAYSQPLLASGVAILVLTLGASHFHFHLLPGPILIVATFCVVGWASLAVIRYDSWLLGVGMLLALFAGPLAARQQLGVVLGYLLAVNLAITLVAYRQKWDEFLIASFLGTYALYFHLFGAAEPWITLLFLGTTYALFLVSGTVFHFLRRTASDFNLGLSLVNPLAFAVVSYKVLLGMPNTLSLAVYTAIALIHLSLARVAATLKGQGDAYVGMAQTNLALGILFSTASISFLTYCNVLDNSYFAPVTFLWIGLGLVLLQSARRVGPHLAPIARRGSYVAMALATAQLLYVIPTMEAPVLVEFPAMLWLLGYFWLHERATTTREERLFSNLVVLAAICCGNQSIVPGFLTTLVSVSALAPLLLLAYLRFPVTLIACRFASLLVAAGITVVAVLSHWGWRADSAALLLLAGLMGVMTPICKRSASLEKESPLGAVLAALLLLRACALGVRFEPGWALALGAVVVFSLYRLSRKMPRLEPAAALFAMGLAGSAFLLNAGLLALGFVTALFFEACREELREGREERALGAAGLAVAVGLRTAFAADSGAGSTLLWSLLGLGLLRLGGRFAESARLVFFVAFLKAITLDANFIYGAGGWEVAAMRTPDLLQMSLVAAVIACFSGAARMSREQVEWRNYFSLFGLLIFAFQVTLVLYNFFGILDTFQMLLSGFWAGAALLFIAYGIHAENRLFRLFGLVVQVSCVSKIYAVDIWVLSAYDKTATTLILGALLMLVSFLYQSNRARLLEPCAV